MAFCRDGLISLATRSKAAHVGENAYFRSISPRFQDENRDKKLQLVDRNFANSRALKA